MGLLETLLLVVVLVVAGGDETDETREETEGNAVIFGFADEV